MVCMDDVFDWFNRLEGHRRIDFLCGVLPMCHPLELRYIGSYLEDLARKDFFILREAELKWNSIQQLCRLVDLSDPYTRSKIITAFALLHSFNTECANQLFLILQSNMQNVAILQSLANLDAAAMQTLLLLSMAVNHPAFTLIQRQEIRQMLDEVIKITGIDNHDKEECEPEVSEISNSARNSPSSKLTISPQSCVRVVLTDITVTSSRRREEDKKLEFQIQVHWSNGITIDMCKTHGELLEFHNKLIHLFPDEAGAHRQDRQIPYLHPSKRSDEIAQISTNVTNYMRQMLSVPLKILESDHVRQFFCDPTFSPSTPSSRTHSSLGGATSQNGSATRLNSSMDESRENELQVSHENKDYHEPETDENQNQNGGELELRPSNDSLELRRSNDSLRKSSEGSIKGTVNAENNTDQDPDLVPSIGRRTSESNSIQNGGGARSSCSECSPRKVDGDTQTEEEFLDLPLEGVGVPNEVADETEEEGDVTVVVPPISIPLPSSSPPVASMPPPPPPPLRLPPNLALLDPMGGLRPVAMMATTYPQTVLAGGSETITTNRYAYSSQTVGPSPHSSPLPSPLISPRVSGPSMGPPLHPGGPHGGVSGHPGGPRPLIVAGQGVPVPHQAQYHQQPRFQPYDPPLFHRPPPPHPDQLRYDPSRYGDPRDVTSQARDMTSRYEREPVRYGERYDRPALPDSPRYADNRYNGGGSAHDSPRGGPYQHQYPHHQYTRNESPRYDHSRFRDVGRYHRSDSPRGSVSSSQYSGGHRSRHHSQDSQRSGYHSHPPETIAEWLKLLRLHKYSDQLSKYSVDELMSLTEDDLEKEGLTKGARKKLLAQIDKCRAESRLLNGDVAWQYGPLYPLSIVTKTNHKRYQSGGSSSVDSSASFSDCSSPSPSPLTLRKDSVTSDAEYDKDSEVSSSVRSYPSPNGHHPPAPANQSSADDAKQPVLDQNTHFKPLPSPYLDSPTSSPGPQILYPLMPVPDAQKYILESRASQHYSHEKPPHYHHHQHQVAPPSSPYSQPPPATSTPPSGCSQCGCNGDCTTAHPPPPLPYPVRFVTPVTQLGMFPPAFLAGGGGNGLVNPVFHQHLIPNGISPDLLYQTQSTFFLTAANQNPHHSNHHSNPQQQHLMPSVIPANGQFIPVPSSSPAPAAPAPSSGKLSKLTCYNCGQQGHKAADCKEATMDAITHNGQFHLRYGPRADDDR